MFILSTHEDEKSNEKYEKKAQEGEFRQVWEYDPCVNDRTAFFCPECMSKVEHPSSRYRRRKVGYGTWCQPVQESVASKTIMKII